MKGTLIAFAALLGGWTLVYAAPANGDLQASSYPAETVKGKVLQIEQEGYLIQMLHGQEARIRVSRDTTMDRNDPPKIGEWIEAHVTLEGHANTLKKSESARTVQGSLLRVNGNVFVIQDDAGKETRLHVNSETKIEMKMIKVGDRIKAEVMPDEHAISITAAR